MLYNILRPPITERTFEEEGYENMLHDSFMSIPVWKEAHQEPGRLEGSSGAEISSVAHGRDQFCCICSNQFWQVYNPGLCIVSIHLQAHIQKYFIFNRNIIHFTFIL